MVKEPSIDQRKFSDREVREILKRAVENEPPGALPASGGFSLDELKAIAKDVGIDPVRLEHAARAVTEQQDHGSSPIIGIPTFLRYERTVEGELDSTRAATILSVIRRVMGMHGELTEVSGSLEWRTKGSSIDRLVSVSSRGGSTTIEGSANLRQTVVGTYVSGGAVAITLTIMGISSAGPVLFGVFPVAYVALRFVLRKLRDSESAKLERVVDELAQLAHSSEHDSPLSDRAT